MSSFRSSSSRRMRTRSGISIPTSVPTSRISSTSTGRNQSSLPYACRRSSAEKPPATATASSICTKRSTSPSSTNFESQLPIPSAKRYSPIVNENCVTESPRRYDDTVPATSW